MLGSLDSHVNNLSEMYYCNCSNNSNQQIKIKYDDKNITQSISHVQKD